MASTTSPSPRSHSASFDRYRRFKSKSRERTLDLGRSAQGPLTQHPFFQNMSNKKDSHSLEILVTPRKALSDERKPFRTSTPSPTHKAVLNGILGGTSSTPLSTRSAPSENFNIHERSPIIRTPSPRPSPRPETAQLHSFSKQSPRRKQQEPHPFRIPPKAEHKEQSNVDPPNDLSIVPIELDGRGAMDPPDKTSLPPSQWRETRARRETTLLREFLSQDGSVNQIDAKAKRQPQLATEIGRNTRALDGSRENCDPLAEFLRIRASTKIAGHSDFDVHDNILQADPPEDSTPPALVSPLAAVPLLHDNNNIHVGDISPPQSINQVRYPVGGTSLAPITVEDRSSVVELVMHGSSSSAKEVVAPYPATPKHPDKMQNQESEQARESAKVQSQSHERRDRVEALRAVTTGSRPPVGPARRRVIPMEHAIEKEVPKLSSSEATSSSYGHDLDLPSLQSESTWQKRSSDLSRTHTTNSRSLYSSSSSEPTKSVRTKSSHSYEIEPSSGSHTEKSCHTVDQKTVRLLHGKDFVKMIQKMGKRKPNTTLTIKADTSDPSLRFAVQVLPFVREGHRGDFNVVRVGPDNSLEIFYTSMKGDLQTMNVSSHLCLCDYVFKEQDESSSNVLFGSYLKDFVSRAQQGGDVVLVSIGRFPPFLVDSIIDALFHRSKYRSYKVSVQIASFHGNSYWDVLEQKKTVNWKETATRSPQDATDYIDVLSDLQEGRVPESILMQRFSIPHGARYNGTLTLIDYIGGREDGSCIRKLCEAVAHRGKQKVDWKTSSDLLTSTIGSEKVQTRVLGSISGRATRTEEALQTLMMLKTVRERLGGTGQEGIAGHPSRTVDRLSGHAQEHEEVLPTLPRQWTAAQLLEFMARKRLLIGEVRIPSDVTGRLAMRMSKLQLQETFYYGKDSTAMAEKLYVSLRIENDRVARIRVKKRLARERYQVA